MANEFLKHETPIEACQELAKLVSRHTDGRGNGIHATAIAQLEFMRESVAPTALRAVYEPTLCIILQGRKETLLGQETYHYGAAQYIVVTVDMPLSGNIGISHKWCDKSNLSTTLHCKQKLWQTLFYGGFARVSV